MVKAVTIAKFGGPEVLRVEDMEVPAPGPGEVLIKHQAISVHFADILLRQGTYFLKPELPATMGLEAVGIIDAVGPGVDAFKPGDKAGYMFNLGAYAQARVMPAQALIPIPSGLDSTAAAAGLLRGLTAHYLITQACKVKAGDSVLVHAAAGGMGQILTQWAKHLGAEVIGTAGSDDKCSIAAANGCNHVINYDAQDFAARVLELTDGSGVHVVYDSVGAATYAGNVACLRALGYFVNFGHASGLLPPIDAMQLNAKSLVFTKTSLKDYIAPEGALAGMAKDVFGLIEQGVLTFRPTTYPLADAARAHEEMSARKTTGQVILVP